jgi:multiple sugar transport system ATP-binding protein
MAEVRLQKLWKIYGGVVQAVKELNLVCNDKEFLCLLGPSGCGKSTTLRMVAGLEIATQGRVFIAGKDVTNTPPKDRDIAMVFENYALYPHLTVYENIAMPLKVRGLSPAEVDQKVKAAAEVLHITDLLGRRTVRLGGGQKQRVGIGRAIVRNPAVFLMDEPISHLEAQLRAQMRVELKRLHIEVESTTIYVTHDQLEALALADRIAVMNLGVLQQVGTAAELFDRPANQFVASFIGTPPMNFINCELITQNDEVRVRGEGFEVPLSPAMRQKLLARKAVGKLQLGIRPLDLAISRTEGAKTSVAAQTFVYEPQGETCQVTVEIDGQSLSAEADGDFVTEPGDKVWIGFNPDRLHLFEASSGENVAL